jgi:diadenosine tetraphosphate (Ap4A) HIT family hydrolase
VAFVLDKRLEGDSYLAVTHKHIQIRLADDTRYFWVILVPAITRDQNSTFVSEIHDLPAAVAADLWSLASHISRWLQAQAKADSINIAALGNVVNQLHLHVVARHRSDPAWPAPIWGHGAMDPLETSERDRRLASLQNWYKQASGTI